jgi:rare lipoprotein A
MGDKSTRSMMLRVSIAAAFVFGGSITAAFAASDAAPAATEIQAQAADAASALPHFTPADAGLVEASDALTDSTGAAAEEADEVAEDLGSGIASWYGAKFAGNRTASGERFDPGEYTAAHRTLPFGSRVKVSRGDKSVIVRINDRGPFHGNRVIDLSRAAAADLGLVSAGRGQVELALLD